MTNRRKMRRSVQSTCFGASAIVCLAILGHAIVCPARASPDDTAGAPLVAVRLLAGRSATGEDQLSPACDDSPMSTACPQQDNRA